MSDKDTANFDSPEKEEFLKRNVKMKKICPQCKREYTDENILFCYYDGNRLTEALPGMYESQQTQPPVQRMNSFTGEFGGFELNLQNTGHNVQIPPELINSITRIIQTNPKMPSDSENVKTWFWAIPSPKRKRNFISKLVNHVGFSRTNLFSYTICYFLIAVTYGLWVVQIMDKLNQKVTINLLYDPNFLALAAFATMFTLVILILPIVSLGYTATDIMQSSRKDFFLRIEPIILVMALVLNYLIFRFTGPIPILIIPGEPKIKGTPPTEHVVRSLKKSIYPSVLLAIGAFAGYALVKYYHIGSTFIQMNLEIMALFGLTILLFELMPFGNFIGKILLKYDATVFSVSFVLIIALLMVTISMSAL